ncbi:delta-lactam-biosynthetic de-N-acetylase [Alkalihalobacillus hwajinpoensis]|uniref:delta-lactam-biosynthetic de-N-acetylase n=1 Tax=Guptibacillus hwajinpoensis TaxID=208199 RepID=UPI001883D4EA|nr:delta-lactam-biosynthetic de-N-acetylase [Pseudalkalibacillus hwajinpoensis]MBF0706997.1 delta-lactam-biosynthetic de-N-acetylase [Pseudalkalibacillus hwajinpoensis]
MRILVMTIVIFIGTVTGTYAIDNTSHDWYFKRSKNHAPATTEPEFQELLKPYDSYFIGRTDQKELYMTFDNGYENGFTDDILDVLKKEDVPATFFVTGHYLKDQPDLVKRMVKEGHIVGNHSWSHPDMTAISDEKIRIELKKVKEEYTRLTGDETMQYVRPPRGVFSERSLAISYEEGYRNIFWSLAYKDWETDKQKGSQYAYDSIMKQVHPGAILLLHTVSKDNAEALQKVIKDLKKDGYTFKSLDDLVLTETIPEPLIP